MNRSLIVLALALLPGLTPARADDGDPLSAPEPPAAAQAADPYTRQILLEGTDKVKGYSRTRIGLKLLDEKIVALTYESCPADPKTGVRDDAKCRTEETPIDQARSMTPLHSMAKDGETKPVTYVKLDSQFDPHEGGNLTLELAKQFTAFNSSHEITQWARAQMSIRRSGATYQLMIGGHPLAHIDSSLAGGGFTLHLLANTGVADYRCGYSDSHRADTCPFVTEPHTPDGIPAPAK